MYNKMNHHFTEHVLNVLALFKPLCVEVICNYTIFEMSPRLYVFCL